MHHRNLSSEIIRLRRGLDLPFTPAEEAQQARRDIEIPRDSGIALALATDKDRYQSGT